MSIESLKQAMKRRLPGLAAAKHAFKERLQRVRCLGYFWGDGVNARRYMRWDQSGSSYWQLSSELLFQYHKLEKGMCMPGEPRFFGDQPALSTMRLMEVWEALGFDRQDPVYRGAMDTLACYRAKIEPFAKSHPAARRLQGRLDGRLAGDAAAPGFQTPVQQEPLPEQAAAVFAALTQTRRSVRNFKADPVPRDRLEAAIRLAQLSPSACNRQPWHTHVFSDRVKIDSLLTLQNGNRGFGHTVPLLLILTVETTGFFDASERHQPYIDGGLFTMSLLYALQSQGLASCCLNWCVSPAIDAAGHRAAGIADSERILMFLAVGEATEGGLVPRSPRRALANFVHFH